MKRATARWPTLLLVNPSSRRGRAAFPLVARALKSRVNLIDATLTASPGDMQDRIRRALARGVRRFVVGGGDGTLSQAADILAQSEGVLGVLPVGTGNTFAHGLGLPTDLDPWLSLIESGPIQRYDVGLAVKGSARKVFLNSLTMGVSERLVELLSREQKLRWGYCAWVAQFHRALLQTPVLHVELSWSEGHDAYETRQLLVVNGRTLAASISPTPLSSGQDGLLEVFRLGNPSLWSIVRLGAKLLAGRLISDREAHYRALTAVTLAVEPPLPVNIDGDLWQSPPMSCRVLPGALAVIAPEDSGPPERRWPLVMRTVGAPRRLAVRTPSYSSQGQRFKPPDS
ncbi:MAG: diacylglycerol kinase family protein [Firmicutes bacterium]|nr:diacylglycerol kinase family protein [Bacillota bacterium]